MADIKYSHKVAAEQLRFLTTLKRDDEAVHTLYYKFEYMPKQTGAIG
jgi:hypothetical protein